MNVTVPKELVDDLFAAVEDVVTSPILELSKRLKTMNVARVKLQTAVDEQTKNTYH